MKKLKITFLVMLMFCAQNLKSQNILPAENVFNLYFDSFVRYNDDSLKELNSYLINFLGKESTHKMNLRDTYTERVDYFTQLFLSNLPSNVASECKDEARNYFVVLIDNFKDAKYNIKTIKPVFNENIKNQEISEVNYEVSFKVPENASELNIGDVKKIDAAEMKKYLVDLTIQFKKASKTVTTVQKFNMFQIKAGNDTYYWNGGPQEMTWKLNEFYFKNIN